MLPEDVLAQKQLLKEQPAREQQCRDNHGQPDAAEEMKRARKVSEDETDGQNVEEDTEGARQSVMRAPASARKIFNRHLRNQCAFKARHGRNEAVHLPVERD